LREYAHHYTTGGTVARVDRWLAFTRMYPDFDCTAYCLDAPDYLPAGAVRAADARVGTNAYPMMLRREDLQ
jgi:hypothetical protein